MGTFFTLLNHQIQNIYLQRKQHIDNIQDFFGVFIYIIIN